MPVNILMPALSPTMEKGNLARWLKKEGDAVKAGDVIAEIETDKATMEYESIDDGVLAKIVVPEGTQDVAVNQLIAVLATEGEDPKAAASAAGKAAAAKDSAPAKQKAPEPAKPAAAQPAPLRHRPPARNRRPPPQRTAPTACSRRPWRAGSPRTPASTSVASRAPDRTAGSSRATSRPRSRARGSRQRRAQPPARRWRIQAPSDDKIRALFEPGSFDVIPHDNMRKVIARRLIEAKLTIPHFYLTLDCNIGKLLAAREEINAAAPKDKDGKPAYKISVNDFVIKALALALQRVPDANVTWTEGGMLKHKHSDIGVAVSIPGGLITPIVRHAEAKSLSVISNEMKDYAGRARAKKLKPEEYQGGSSAVSNLGMYGIKDFAAVINPPHATILAVGVGEERAIVTNGKIEAAWMMSVTLSTDHRAVDGALGAEMLGAFKTFDRESGDDGGLRFATDGPHETVRIGRTAMTIAKSLGGVTRRHVMTGAAALGASTLICKPAIAQAWSPTKNIRIIVPFPAGATTDMLARLFAQRMTESLGQTVLVENVGGAGGALGADQVAKAAPDGHTLLFHNITFTTTTTTLSARQEIASRHRGGLRAGLGRRLCAVLAAGASRRAGERPQGVRGLGEADQGQAELRLDRPRQHHEPDGRGA